MPNDLEVRPSELKNHIARAVLVAPDRHIHTGEINGYEIVLTFRPGSSKVGRYELALPGGKITIDEGDFDTILTPEQLADPNLVLSVEEVTAAAYKAVIREVKEELGYILVPELLRFVNATSNDAGYITYTYLAELPDKPTLQVKENSAGTRWMDVQEILEGEPALLNGHLDIARTALRRRRKHLSPLAK